MTTSRSTHRPSELGGACEVHGMTRSSFILRGALAAGARLWARGGHAVRLPRTGRNRRGRRGNPQLRPHAGVPGVGVLQRQGQAGRAERRGEDVCDAVRRTRRPHMWRRLRRRSSSSAGRRWQKPQFVFPVSNESSFLALASVLENTGVGAYNGAAPSSAEQAGARVGRQHRAGRGPSRGGDRPADRQEPDAERGLRHAADQGAGARRR